jgi:hypothetical protein
MQRLEHCAVAIARVRHDFRRWRTHAAAVSCTTQS